MEQNSSKREHSRKTEYCAGAGLAIGVSALYLIILVAQALVMAQVTYGAPPMLHLPFLLLAILAVVLTIA